MLSAGVTAVIAGNRMIEKERVQTDKKNIEMEDLTLTTEWDKIFPKSDKVNHSKVTFRNRYGITLAADLYTPKNAEGEMAAIAVSGPFGAVKEQASGLYAQTMAEHGFLTIAFDPSYTGESGGTPRYVASPDINTEDFCAAVDFLSIRDDVDPERIGIIGICGWGGMAINAAAIDTRIKATVASTMYDMSRVSARRCSLVRKGLSQLLQNQPRLSQAVAQLQRRMEQDIGPFVHQHASALLQRRNPQCRAHDTRRESALPLFQRRRVQETDG